MRFFAIAVGAMLASGISGSALAQNMFEQCERQKAAVTTVEQQSQQLELDLSTTNNQLVELQRRETELRQKQTQLSNSRAELQRRLGVETRERERQCSFIQQCQKHEQTADQLKQRIAPQESLLRNIRQEIQGRSAESNRLNAEVDRISGRYGALNCENLVPGQTAQSNIDECNDLFSQWNKLQADINALDSSIASLQNNYQRGMQDMRANKAELDRLLASMRGSCSHSPRVAELETMQKDQSGYVSLQDDFTRIFSNVKRFRGLKVVKPIIKQVNEPPGQQKEPPGQKKKRLRVVR